MKVTRNLLVQTWLVLVLLLSATIVKGSPSGEEVSMGTTILAIRYRDGVVVGADSRTSASGYVSNRYATKVSFVLEDDFGLNLAPPSEMQLQSSLLKHDNGDVMELEDVPLKKTSTCCICRSGSAADTQYIADQVRHQLLRRKIVHHTSSTVTEVANLLKNYLNNDSLSASLICAGYDHLREEGVIFSIDLGGTLMEQPFWACSGSGSTFVIGHIDQNYPLDGAMMTEEEAVEFVGNAIELAMDRDGSSGGIVRLYVIDENGKRGILRSPQKYSNSIEDRNIDAMASLSKFAPPVTTRRQS